MSTPGSPMVTQLQWTQQGCAIGRNRFKLGQATARFFQSVKRMMSRKPQHPQLQLNLKACSQPAPLVRTRQA